MIIVGGVKDLDFNEHVFALLQHYFYDKETSGGKSEEMIRHKKVSIPFQEVRGY